MEQFKLFIELTRLKKPIGYMLLFWPCAWGLTVAYDFSREINTYLFYLFLFFSGSILMRSAGCIVNDIVDRNYDKKVFRTKNRPIASGKVSVQAAIICSLILCLVAFIVLIQFNNLTIILALGSMPLAFTYPLMKRYTYWPQLFLGVTFNYGLILGWTAIHGKIDLIPIVLYLGAIFWTLGYDTIYGLQDVKDDEIIGLKSTSLKFKKNYKEFVFVCYSIFLICLIFSGYLIKLNLISLIFLILLFIYALFFEIKKVDINNSSSCLKAFKLNNFMGLIIFLILWFGKI